MTDFTVRNGQTLRCGFTTGSCAAAAAKGCALMLTSSRVPAEATITLPSKKILTLPLAHQQIINGSARCCVKKDAGDDPDVTNGLEIFATMRLNQSGKITILGGEGIGTVTLPGLPIAPGNAAINPTPLAVIEASVREVLPGGCGCTVTISAPGGDLIAGQTYNPKLGIVGGISILGTSGIVTPMSEEAWIQALELELSVLHARGMRRCAFVFGNYGADFLHYTYRIPYEHIVVTSNFIGTMLEKAQHYGMTEILIAGHIGKLVKLAGGIFNTHSKIADARLEILTAFAALEGAGPSLLNEIYNCVTAAQAAKHIQQSHLTGVFDRIATSVSRRCHHYTHGKIGFGTVLFTEQNQILAADTPAAAMIKELQSP